ncbi:UDP-N-acetylglucosamine--N-acetylmuramyl-(pentapeptide) pyrophosphoryl-undecaprenol N-acetylglucosamine transferase [Limisalsivibrio acetivorans]|uniref:UDP-N-acetylglucosamine--N-acetylmuramyl- (pentapeptide) pyrophosphoryl-undecaprenol N-acetylglucosamine transferase n=1 Tax=Limisalsivibrio acetivorans TaxID=1304888 RepID=UPI0003B63EDC|nr:UDP-N-acetylglucosamine--N-acetylmuramyl-(pentapeptide) pyrophosphoryl-undecaprenol N-acetylglucosamine transferase [Limisalsivibrio acetivorans]
MSRLLIAGGGTGGHLYPGIAVAEEVKDRVDEILFLVTDRGLERRILSERGYSFIEQRQTPLKGTGVLRRISSLMGLGMEFFRMLGVVKRGDKVLLTGGFASAAPAAAALVKGAELYLHEQNSVMGLTNKAFARFCRKVFLSFEETKEAKGRTVWTGNPVRKELAAFAPKERSPEVILVLGGSQGSRFINTLVAKASPMLMEEGYTIVHQAGLKLLDETKLMYEENGVDPDRYPERIVLKGYINDMVEEYSKADIIIARSGSGSVFETVYSRRPAVFIPLKASADNHQLYNARYAEKLGVARVLEEDGAEPARLLEILHSLNSPEVFKSLSEVKYMRSAEMIAGGMNI